MDFKKIVLSIFSLLLFVGLSYGQSSLELKKQRERIDREIAELQKILSAKTQEKLLSQQEVAALSKQLDLRENKISTINSELRIINKNISSNNAIVDKLKAELEKMRQDYEKMILFAFRNKNSYNKMMFIFASKDFNQAFKRVKYLQQFTDARKIKVAEIEGTKKQIELKIAQLERDKKTQQSLLKEQEAERNTIAKDKAAHSQELNQLAREERTFRGQLTKKQQEKKRLDAAIKTAIAREVEAARRAEEERRRRLAEAEAKKTGTTVTEAEKKIEKKTGSAVLNNSPEATKLSAGFSSNRGRLPWPVGQGSVVRNYGSVTVERGVRDFYDYIRIRTSDGAPVKTVFEGTVLQVINIGSYAVVVQHGEYLTAYSNLKSVSVSKGQKISTGTVIGAADSDPEVGYSYIDLSVYRGTTSMNPSIWIAR
ncbi:MULTISPECIES: murein hydrolase activator EnvC family protein [Sphingobacterium]|uniref:Peptidase M23 n=1 Tax=Sphingobacterium cellulitidis TaxID=1768011 RepID=A0A8H9KVY4_9SPHI|nr:MULTISPECIES: peptidoglycan DD-metalloendopeptidase family protein [Sphingobacterium]MBA8987649.1 septal ring factor EnvC (AmiA/AmiB activator) [Sphingobacterium soli]OYD43570.1 peptidase M23 [Sphingobacterium cellulitidis]OYD46041.1 peptidase M23 [Sphingobacterium cellulitidis]WFB64322.1 peptidoglycan DD-metalloendopeptidase family protein [Sphingobacterium sp. WM]GGE22010.1 peptidase M23 [Sphingobacterium soli]